MLNLLELKIANKPLDNRYQVIEKIGGGGFSEVWLAHDLKAKVDVVIKVYSSSEELDEEGIRMFRKEFTLVCDLNHSNILRPFAYDISAGSSPYLVMPYCSNGSASKLIGKATEDEVWEFAKQVAEGLSYLHAHNIIHQDIKPANVLINGDNQYLITDFGISSETRNTIRKSLRLYDYSLSGTRAYMSYECLKTEPINVMARDIWAFGATLYELITGDVPFGEDGGINQNYLKEKKPKLNSDISKDMKTLILKCLEFEPWNRPSADEVLKIIKRHFNPIKPWMVCVAVASIAIIIGINFYISSPKIDIDPIDHKLVAQVEVAGEIIMNENDLHSDMETLEIEKITEGARKYRQTIEQKPNEETFAKCDSIWQPSQKIIDNAYCHYMDKMNYYSNIGADEAAHDYEIKCDLIKEFVSDKTLNEININKK